MRNPNAKVFTRNRVVMGILVCILILPLGLSTGRMEAAIGFLICLLIIIGAVHLMKRSTERP
ncbi:MAG: hypothetical protein ACYC67_02300 [Prosthecobacter sp.]